MKRQSTTKYAMISLFITALFLFWQPWTVLSESTATGEVWGAWQTAQDIGVYEYQTTIIQTTHPLATLENVGSSSQEHRFYVEGETNLPQRMMELKLWAGGGSVHTDQGAVQLRVVDGKAMGRVGESAWTEVDDVSSLFAPGRDSLGYLAAAANIQRLGTETRAGITFTRYTFDLDGVTFAEHMRASMEEDLQRQGKLPNSINLSLVDNFVDMTGNGEIWLDADGLPLRQLISLTFPPDGSKQIEAEIKTDFSKWGERAQLASIGDYLLMVPRWVLDGTLTQATASLSLIIALLAAALLAFLTINRRKLYNGLALSVIISMLLTPILQTYQVSAFYEGQTQQQRNYETDQKRAEAREEITAALTRSTFDPHKNPLEGVENGKVPVSSDSAAYATLIGDKSALAPLPVPPNGGKAEEVPPLGGFRGANTLALPPTSPSHGDNGIKINTFSPLGGIEGGLTNHSQSHLNLNPTLPTDNPLTALLNAQTASNARLPGVAPFLAPTTEEDDDDGDGLRNDLEMLLATDPTVADTDGDGLSDGVEFFEIGTSPTDPDSDGDDISDAVEVQGFEIGNGIFWYLNPLEVDTNGDGMSDTAECLALTSMGSGDHCPDSDGDDIPDPFDRDNDNDGVPDRIDLAPDLMIAGGTNNGEISGLANDTFNLRLDNLSSKYPTTVDFQLRPTNPDHLWYALNVLDWPGGDRDGQVQRVLNSTFGDSGKDADGDLRLIPVLELKIPYQAGHYGNLPIIPGAPPVQPDTPLEDWLDTDLLDEYRITVRREDGSGNLLVYVPLVMVQNSETDTRVAFSGRMLYHANTNDFGHTHQFRLLWLVQAITDYCLPVPDNFRPEGVPEEERVVVWCSDDNNWRENPPSVIHSYYDEWYLTGLEVREDRGVDVAVAFENPDLTTFPDRDLNYDENLWWLARGLEQTFIAGRRDITPAEIARRFDRRTNSGVSDTERWGIDQNALIVESYSYADQTGLLELPLGETTQILNTHFLDNGAPLVDAPTLLFAREERYRRADLESGTGVVSTAAPVNGVIVDSMVTFDLDPTNIVPETVASYNWAPYRYQGANVWEAYPITEYWDLIGDRYETMFDTVLGPDEPYNEGRAVLAQLFYVAVYGGVNSQVEIGNVPIVTSAVEMDDTNLNLGALQSSLGRLSIVARSTVSFILNVTSRQPPVMVDFDANGDFIYYREDPDTRQRTILEGAEADNALQSQVSPEYQLFKDILSVGQITASVAIFSLQLVSAFVDIGLEGQIVLQTLTIINTTLGAVSATADTVRAVANAGGSVRAAITGAMAASRATVVLAVIGVIISIAIAVGFFLYEVISSGIEPFSLAFNQALAALVATIIVTILITTIGFIPVIGPLITAIIFLIDSIIATVCQFAGGNDLEGNDIETVVVRDYVCAGISGALARLIQFLIYSQNPIVDLQADDRLNVTNFNQTLWDPGRGIAVHNMISISADVDTTIHRNFPHSPIAYTYFWQYANRFLRHSTYRYEFQLETHNTHGRLNTNQMSGAWDSAGRDKFVARQQIDSGYIVALNQAGLNQPVTLFLAEGSVVHAQECFLIPIPPTFFPAVPVCYLRPLDDTTHLDVGAGLKYDVFPETLDDFYALIPDNPDDAVGYRLNWDNNAALDFPILRDADGDGLRSRFYGGNDPNDNQPDTDFDGLSDFYEIQHNFDPTRADADEDGLTDYEEVHYGTIPTWADSDNDGLRDGEEVMGWEFVYDFDSDDNPLVTLVTSDPLLADTDGDMIIDKLEAVYGFNPRVFNRADVLTLQSEIIAENLYYAPGQTVLYEATIDNELRGRYALGLLDVESPAVVDVQGIHAVPYNLAPRASVTLGGQATLKADLTQSGPVSLTNVAGAIISQLRPQATGNRNLWLRFNEGNGATSFYDSSGNGNTFTCYYCPASAGGYAGSGAHFNTNSNYLYKNPIDVSETSYTFSAWFNTNCTGCGLASTYGGGGHDRSIHFSDGKVCANLRDETGLETICTTSTYNNNQWHNLVYTFGGVQGGQKIYIDGVLRAQGNADHSTINQGLMYVGRSAYGGNYSGYLDEVEIFPYAMLQDDIDERLAAPVLHNRFDYRSGNSLPDVSLYGNNTVCNGGRCPSFGTGMQNNAAYFNRAQDISVSSSRELSLNRPGNPTQGEFTFAAWVRPQADNGNQRHVLFGLQTRNQYAFPSNPTRRYPSLIIQGSNLRVEYDTTNTANASPQCSAIFYNAISQNAWQHLTVSFDGGGIDLYRNGTFWSRNTTCSGRTPLDQSDLRLSQNNSEAVINFSTVYVGDEGDGSGLAEHTLQYHQLGNIYGVWNRGSIDDNNNNGLSYGIGQYRYIYDGNTAFTYCENDDSPNNICNGGDDWLVFRYVSPYVNAEYATYYNGDGWGYLYWDVYNQFYKGWLDDLRIYNHALSGDEATQLFRDANRRLELRFDDAPGQLTFSDFTGNSGGATCSGDTCPVSGIAGRANQAARFDGVDDYLTLGSTDALGLRNHSFTVGAWVYGYEFGAGDRSILGTDQIATNYGLHLVVRDGNPYMGFYGNDLASTTTLQPNQWNHLVWRYDIDARTQTMFLNGSQIASASGRNPFLGTGAVSVGRSVGFRGYFNGLIDQLTIFDQPLSNDQITELYLRTPSLNLHFDEPLGATSFDNDSDLSMAASCSGDACPAAGVQGRMRQSVMFDGLDDGLSVPHSGDLALTDFSAGLWVKPTKRSDNGYQPLMVRSAGDGEDINFGLFIRPGGFGLQYMIETSQCNYARHSAASLGALLENQWNHVMLTYREQGNLSLYINGSLDSEIDTVGTFACRTGTLPIWFGEMATDSLPFHNETIVPFSGQMDEAMHYGFPLLRREVRALYEYQIAWYDLHQDHTLTIDAEPPTVNLDMGTSYLPMRDIVLAIQAEDATSYVDRVEYRLDGGDWQLATRDEAIWTFVFNPTAPGAYTIETRAFDAVGHQKTTTAQVVVDDSQPTITLDPALTESGLPAYPTSTNATWQVNLGGAWDDAAGSGVASIYVELLRPSGASLNGPQLANVGDHSWQIAYTNPDVMEGMYILQVKAVDMVGNVSQIISETITVNGAAPHADLIFQGDITGVLTGTGSLAPEIKGTFSRIPYPTGADLHWHFEEPAGATTFYDATANQTSGVCSGGTCPTAAQSGQLGQAVLFDGVDDVLYSDVVHDVTQSVISDSTTLDDLTIATWLNWNGPTGSNQMLVYGGDAGSNGYGLFIDPAGHLNITRTIGTQVLTGTIILSESVTFSQTNTSLQLTANTWQHIALTVNDETWQLYLNGLEMGSFTFPVANAPFNGNLSVGADQNGARAFGGLLDEVVYYNRALMAEQLEAIANPMIVPPVTLNRSAVVTTPLPTPLSYYAFEEANGATSFADDGAMANAGTCTGTTCPAIGDGRWGGGVTFDGVNDYISLGNFQIEGEITLAAWIKPTTTSGLRNIINHGHTTTPNGEITFRVDNGYYSIGSWDGVGHVIYYPISPEDTGHWVHLAGVYDGTAWRLYRNGFEVDSVEDPVGAIVVNENWAIGARGTGTERFYQGGIDEAAIYDVALTPLQIQQLANTRQPVLQLHLDEGANSTTFSDGSPAQNHVTCLDTPTCPTSGTPGQQGFALTFDGSDDYLRADHINPDLNGPGLSFGGWVYPQSEAAGQQGVMSFHTAAGDNQIILFYLSDTDQFSYYDNVLLFQNSTSTFAPNNWYHVFVTIDTDDRGTLYINGQPELVFTTTVRPAGNGRFSLGQEWDEGRPTDFFNGRLDEVGVYPYALTPLEIQSLIDLNGDPALILALDEVASSTVFSDTSPHSRSFSCSTNCPTAGGGGRIDRGLALDGGDDYLAANEVTYNLNSNALSFGGWVYPTRSDGDPEAVISFQTVNGEDRNLLYYHPASDQFSFYDPATGQQFTTDPAAPNRWHHLFAVIDSENNGTLYLNGLPQVTFKTTVRPVSGGQLSLGQAWNNATPGELFQGRLDQIEVYPTVLAAKTVQKMALPGEPVLHLALDEVTDSTAFSDSSLSNNQATCAAPTCPLAGFAGRLVAGLQFDGVDDYVQATLATGAVDDLTFSAWVNWRGPTATGQTIFYNGNTSTDGYGFFIGTDGLLKLLNGGVLTINSNTQLTPGLWHHLTAVRQAGVWQLYVDGIPKTLSNSQTMPNTPSGGTWLGANQTGGEAFNGRLDEVRVYEHALNEVEIKTLMALPPTPAHLGENRLEVSLRHTRLRGVTEDIILNMAFEDNFGARTFQDSSPKANHGWCQGSTCPITTTGQFGGAYHFDGVDDAVTIGKPYTSSLPGGDLHVVLGQRGFEAISDSLTIAAWVNLNDVGANQTILASDQTHSENGFGFGFADAAMRFTSYGLDDSFSDPLNMTPDTWYHVAAVLHSGVVSFYLNGQLVSTHPHPTPILSNSDDLMLVGDDLVGALDDLLVYHRALTAEEITALADPTRWEAVSMLNPTANFSTWSHQIPAGLEGTYTIDLRATDSFGHSTLHLNAWQGEIDTRAPRLTLSRANPSTELGGGYYSCFAEDYNLTEDGVQCPAEPTCLSPVYMSEPWYTELVSATKLYQLEPICETWLLDANGPYTLSACDAFNNCTSVTPTDLLARSSKADVLAVINSPVPQTALTSLTAISLTGEAYALNQLNSLTATVDGSPIQTIDWSGNTFTNTAWAVSWTPSAEGSYQLGANVVDKNGLTAQASPITVYVDTTPPVISLAGNTLSQFDMSDTGFLTVRGLATDTVGLKRIAVMVDYDGYNSGWVEAIVPTTGNAWATSVYLGSNRMPDGELITISARATDFAGQTDEVAVGHMADAVPPTLGAIGLAYAGPGGTTPLTPGMTIADTLSPTLTINWTAASDAHGIAQYYAGWTTSRIPEMGDLTAYPAGTISHTQAVGEGLAYYAHLIAEDSYGNRTAETVGPIYSDYLGTPGYLPALTSNTMYNGWLENSCNLLGVDRRIALKATDKAALGGAQTLYATWDETALRLAWLGANWDADGDLFIYLDTAEGGSNITFNPYSTLTETTIYLPGMTPDGQPAAFKTARTVEPGLVAPRRATTRDVPPLMAADYIIWVRDTRTAQLVTWTGSDWQVGATLSADNYQYWPVFNDGQTDLLIPFSWLGISDPAATPVSLSAFASDENEMRLWSVMPSANPRNSTKVVATMPYADNQRFALTRAYRWDALASGQCPNGLETTLINQNKAPRLINTYPDSDLQFTLSVDPHGTVYNFLRDDMFWLWGEMFDNIQAVASANFTFMDNTHAHLGDGQTVTYTLQYENRGDDMATNVRADISTWYALHLPDGTHLHEEGRDNMVIALGDIPPGATGTATFQGVIDLATTTAAYYQPCVDAGGDPLQCENTLTWAALDAHIYDDAHDETGYPVEWIWSDHEVDNAAPQFFGLTSPYILKAGDNTLSGYAYDISGVPTLEVEVHAPQTNDGAFTCTDNTPDDGWWACDWNTVTYNNNVPPVDGDRFKFRIRTTDGQGQAGEWMDWRPFTIDTIAPVLTLDLVRSDLTTAGLTTEPFTDGLVVFNYYDEDAYNLVGALTDNHGVGSVEVCQDDTCEPVSVDLPPTPWFTYEDVPATPLAIDASTTCGGTELVRTITVADSFVIGDISLGFMADHTFRNDIQAKLTSPAGTTVQGLIGSPSRFSGGENYDLTLNDAHPTRLFSNLDDNLAPPFYDRRARPFAPMRVFHGQEAQGDWTLTVCDDDPATNDGHYQRSQLQLQPLENAPTAATWTYQGALEKMDNVSQTITVTGLDLAGNRTAEPLKVAFWLDNVPPVITLTTPTSDSVFIPQPSQIEGTVSDGSGVRAVNLVGMTPTGEEMLWSAVVTGNTWVFTDTAQFVWAGHYMLWVEAIDDVGNITSIGPYSLEIAAIVSQQVYMPLILKAYEAQPSAPDLIIRSATVTTTTVTLEVGNTGSTVVTEAVRVDLYFDPTSQPIPGTTWDSVSTYGAHWVITEPITPGAVIRLTLTDTVSSNYPTDFTAVTEALVQVDSAAAVPETHEILGEIYNNLVTILLHAGGSDDDVLGDEEGLRP